ncbi:MAG: hypothetical protein KDA85_21810, partial [Planctomycetaceae bacterium]|nr:hypothetical protein [Planctomycetaceae bacterium]
MYPTYDPHRTWLQNLQESPAPGTGQVSPVPPFPGQWSWCGIPVESPLGIPAGPLLNSNWLLYYAQLGFDILVYKTVRSEARDCYPLPNLLPVQVPQVSGGFPSVVPASDQMQGTWAVSFGMPSLPPEQWRADVELAANQLPSGKILVVSVVGSSTATGHRQQSHSSSSRESVGSAGLSQSGAANHEIERLANDFALCARWAVESGAQVVEANFSCPNVCSADGQLYQHPEQAAHVAAAIRS